MATSTSNHVNLLDDSGQVYCHYEGDIVTLDGEHIAQVCWKCPYWVGLAGGYGVECEYKDGNLGKGVEKMTYRNAEDARDHAPEATKSYDSIASKDGIKLNQLRERHSTDQEEVAGEVQQDKEEAAAKDVETVAEETPVEELSVGEEVPEAPVPETGAAVPMKKATVADIVGALIVSNKHLPEKHDQQRA